MWPSSRRLALRGRNLTRDNQADGVPMVHQASGGESCQRSFFSRHRTPEPCLKKSILVSCTVQKSEKPTKTRSNRTFRVDYHPHALQKSPNVKTCSTPSPRAYSISRRQKAYLPRGGCASPMKTTRSCRPLGSLQAKNRLRGKRP